VCRGRLRLICVSGPINGPVFIFNTCVFLLIFVLRRLVEFFMFIISIPFKVYS
jgi:hypothetical protein